MPDKIERLDTLKQLLGIGNIHELKNNVFALSRYHNLICEGLIFFEIIHYINRVVFDGSDCKTMYPHYVNRLVPEQLKKFLQAEDFLNADSCAEQYQQYVNMEWYKSLKKKYHNKFLGFKENREVFEELIKRYKIHTLYHFTDKSNIPSIKKYGGLYSWQELSGKNIKIPNPGGSQLSRELDIQKDTPNYVRLCFNKNHPMRYVAEREGRMRSCVFLEVASSVIFWYHTKFSNINATDKLAIIGDSYEDFCRIDFETLKKPDWCNEYEKKVFQAEVMVLKHIPLKYLLNIQNV